VLPPQVPSSGSREDRSGGAEAGASAVSAGPLLSLSVQQRSQLDEIGGERHGRSDRPRDIVAQDVVVQPEMPLLGGCGCGAVRFEVAAPLVSAHYCHCTRCQRRSGTAASANARVAPGSFHIIAGEQRLRAWSPQGGWQKWFCGECGSALFSRHPDDADLLSVRLGAFDSEPGIRPTRRQFVTYAASWEAIPDDRLVRFPERAPPE
jgi:hypothetical protein